MRWDRKEVARARARLYESVRAYFAAEGFDEVETPCLVPAPGMEPHIAAFCADFVPEMEGGRPASWYLHTSPEYAMKRLLAEGFERIWQIAKVFRNGEIAARHNPEFSLLEFYRAHADYAQIMDDLESLVRGAAAQVAGSTVVQADGSDVDLAQPFERVAFREAFRAGTGIDLASAEDLPALRAAAKKAGLSVPKADATWDDAVLRLFLDRVEPWLGRGAATFLTGYPASMAALARLKPGDRRVAERFELYVGGVELANGFSELTDAAEQRRRLVAEQEQRRAAGRPVYPLDEAFLAAVGRMPPSAGVAVGLDRVLMILLGAATIDQVLLFPASGFGR